VTGDGVFLVRDMFATFVPPETIMTRILRGEIRGVMAQTGRSQISDFFKKRTPSDDEAIQIAEILTNIELYEVILRLRNGFLRKEELAKQLNKPAKEVDKQLKNLMKIGIVIELSSEGEDSVYMLRADPQIQVFFPEYMIDNIRAKWALGEISREMAVKHLQLLREEYLV
jgi:biotin operon repressor